MMSIKFLKIKQETESKNTICFKGDVKVLENQQCNLSHKDHTVGFWHVNILQTENGIAMSL